MKRGDGNKFIKQKQHSYLCVYLRYSRIRELFNLIENDNKEMLKNWIAVTFLIVIASSQAQVDQVDQEEEDYGLFEKSKHILVFLV